MGRRRPGTGLWHLQDGPDFMDTGDGGSRPTTDVAKRQKEHHYQNEPTPQLSPPTIPNDDVDDDNDEDNDDNIDSALWSITTKTKAKKLSVAK